MPRFFFHLRTDGRNLPDLEGMVFADIEGARRQAELTGRDLMRPVTDRRSEWIDWSVDVSDGRGRRVFSRAFCDCDPDQVEEPPAAPPSRAVVYLENERAKREISQLDQQIRRTVRNISTLVDRTRYEAKNLYGIIQESEEIRRRSREVLERARAQRPPEDWSMPSRSRLGG
jgi:hypothetical protein